MYPNWDNERTNAWVWDPTGAAIRRPVLSMSPPEEPHPDRRRSDAALFVEERGQTLLMIIQVRGLGAMCFRATSDGETGRLLFEGVSEFTNAEIGKDL